MTTENPALTVAMPAYNAERYIGRAIESILNQTFTDLELVIVEDQSTDDTWRIINEYAARDDRIRVFRNEVNSGAAASSNRAIAEARAPLIAGMDADDISLPHRFETQLAMLRQHPEIAVVGSFVSHTNEADEVLSLSRTGPASISEFEKLRRKGKPTMVFGGTAMYTKDVFDKVGGFDSRLRAAADIELCDRMAEYGPIIAIPEPLLLYRVYSSSNVMLRFREGRLTHRFLEARRAARLAGESLPTREEYAAAEENLSWWRRLNIRRDDFSQYWYRQGGLAFADGRKVRTGLFLLMAGVAGPIHAVRRIWDQRLSPAARRART